MNNKFTISTLIVDDNSSFRKGLNTWLKLSNYQSNYQVEVLGEADSEAETLRLVEERKPNLILLDLELNSEHGTAILKTLREKFYQGKVIVLSAHQEDEFIFRAMQAGANGYVCKDYFSQQLPDAIATVIKDQVYLAPEVASSFFRIFQRDAKNIHETPHSIRLTEREQEVLNLLIQGSSNAQIAQDLYITVATVKAHLTAIFEKLEVTSRAQAIIKALKFGLVAA